MNDNAKTYEDGVRDGFDACRKAADKAIGQFMDELLSPQYAQPQPSGSFVERYTLDLARTRISALTPESPND